MDNAFALSKRSGSRKLLDLKDKGRRDHTLTSAIHGPSSGVHFNLLLLGSFQPMAPSFGKGSGALASE